MLNREEPMAGCECVEWNGVPDTKQLVLCCLLMPPKGTVTGSQDRGSAFPFEKAVLWTMFFFLRIPLQY